MVQSSAKSTNGEAKRPSTRVKELVDYSEKRQMSDIDDDIQHGVAHPTMNELEERVNDLGDSWETESLFEDVLDDLTEDKFFSDGKSLLFVRKLPPHLRQGYV